MAETEDDSTAPLETPFEPLRWIGTYKILKGVLALIAALLLLRLMHRNLPEVALHWMAKLHIEPQSEIGKIVLHRILLIKNRSIGWVAIGLFAYIPLTCAEGIGLMLRKVWAEWLTIVTTAALIPLEVREVILRLTWLRVLLLVLNICVLIYLIVRIRRDRHRHAPPAVSSAITQPANPAADFSQSTTPRQSAPQ
jgi:uncharacterized membrane protein (DUF2068 family)